MNVKQNIMNFSTISYVYQRAKSFTHQKKKIICDVRISWKPLSCLSEDLLSEITSTSLHFVTYVGMLFLSQLGLLLFFGWPSSALCALLCWLVNN
jgi:hypothetical protein